MAPGRLPTPRTDPGGVNRISMSPETADVGQGQPDTSGRAPAPPLGFGGRIASPPSILILCPKVAAITSSQLMAPTRPLFRPRTAAPQTARRPPILLYDKLLN